MKKKPTLSQKKSKESSRLSSFAWGEKETQHFFDLTPGHILEAAETIGVRCTGRCLKLNSMENRVFEVEIELDHPPQNPSDRARIIKFYRPGRWTLQQIHEEHQFLIDLQNAEIPSIPPIPNPQGETLQSLHDLGIYYAVSQTRRTSLR